MSYIAWVVHSFVRFLKAETPPPHIGPSQSSTDCGRSTARDQFGTQRQSHVPSSPVGSPHHTPRCKEIQLAVLDSPPRAALEDVLRSEKQQVEMPHTRMQNAHPLGGHHTSSSTCLTLVLLCVKSASVSPPSSTGIRMQQHETRDLLSLDESSSPASEHSEIFSPRRASPEVRLRPEIQQAVQHRITQCHAHDAVATDQANFQSTSNATTTKQSATSPVLTVGSDEKPLVLCTSCGTKKRPKNSARWLKTRASGFVFGSAQHPT